LARQHLNLKVPQLRQGLRRRQDGEEDLRTDDDDDEKDVVVHKMAGQTRNQ
jgi:hypothetical protein